MRFKRMKEKLKKYNEDKRKGVNEDERMEEEEGKQSK